MNTGLPDDDAMSKGDAAFYSGKVEEAAIWYERALELDPNRERARQRLHDIAEGKIPQAAVPAEAGSAYGRALSLYRRGKYTEAAAEAQRVIDLMGGIPWKDARELLNNCYSGQQAEGAYQDALIEEENGQWPTALRDYDAAVAILPDNHIYAAARDRLKDLMSQANAIRAELRPARSIREVAHLKDIQERIISLEQESSSLMVRKLRADFGTVAAGSLRLLEADISRFLAALSGRQGGEVETAIAEVERILEVAEFVEEISTANPDLNHALESIQEVRFRQQTHKQLLQSAKLAIQAAEFELAFKTLEKARSMFQVPSKELDELAQIAQTGLELQKKYYELMRDGENFMAKEDYESAMRVFQEADTLIRDVAVVLPLNRVSNDMENSK